MPHTTPDQSRALGARMVERAGVATWRPCSYAEPMTTTGPTARPAKARSNIRGVLAAAFPLWAGASALALPEAWMGVWVGETQSRTPGTPSAPRTPESHDAPATSVTSFRTELRIAPTEDPDRFTWVIIYGEGDARQVRPYEIVVIDRERGRYVIDEKNSIMIDMTLVAFEGASSLRSIFELGDVRIVASYTLRDGAIEMEFGTFGAHDDRVSGGEGQIPEVRSSTLRAAQRGVLRPATLDAE